MAKNVLGDQDNLPEARIAASSSINAVSFSFQLSHLDRDARPDELLISSLKTAFVWGSAGIAQLVQSG